MRSDFFCTCTRALPFILTDFFVPVQKTTSTVYKPHIHKAFCFNTLNQQVDVQRKI